MASVNTMNTFPQVYVDDDLIKRSQHTITAVTISSSLVVVVVYGGESPNGNELSDTVVLEFGEYTIVTIIQHTLCMYDLKVPCSTGG